MKGCSGSGEDKAATMTTMQKIAEIEAEVSTSDVEDGFFSCKS